MNNKTLSIILVVILAGILVMFLAFRPDTIKEDNIEYPTDPSLEQEGEALSPTQNTNTNTDSNTGTPSTSPTSTVITAKLNQPVSFAGGTGTITEILEDSRCPIDVQCIQAGTVRVKANLTYAGLTQSVNLTLNQPYTLSGQSITLTGVSPAPRSTQPTLPGDYVFTLRINM